MGLSFSTVEKTYEVFEIIKKEFLKDLKIPKSPNDVELMDDKANLPTRQVLGWDRKYDNGWENIFFVLHASEVPNGLQERFEELAKEYRIGNSLLFGPTSRNKNLHLFGWF